VSSGEIRVVRRKNMTPEERLQIIEGLEEK